MTIEEIKKQEALRAFSIYKNSSNVSCEKVELTELPVGGDPSIFSDPGAVYFGRIFGLGVNEDFSISIYLQRNQNPDESMLMDSFGAEGSFMTEGTLFSSIDCAYSTGKVFVECYKLN